MHSSEDPQLRHPVDSQDNQNDENDHAYDHEDRLSFGNGLIFFIEVSVLISIAFFFIVIVIIEVLFSLSGFSGFFGSFLLGFFLCLELLEFLTGECQFFFLIAAIIVFIVVFDRIRLSAAG